MLKLTGLIVCCIVGCQHVTAATVDQTTELATEVTSCHDTGKKRAAPTLLSATCLYTNIRTFKVSPELTKFTPNYQLWSDGSNKSRWIYWPANSKIDTSDPDRWVFPVGTQIFKEFRQFTQPANKEIKVETRHLQKITPGTGADSWLLSTYQWNSAQTDATLSVGASNVLSTDHDIPSEQDCVDCHQGNTDLVLGFDAIQLSDLQGKYAFGFGPGRGSGEWTLSGLQRAGKLTHPVDMPVLPGSPLAQKALGYLHANCGNCHNPLGLAAEQEAEHLKFRHQLAFTTLEQTDVYQTAVNQQTHNFTAVPYIILGASNDELALYQSAVFLRMNSTDENYRMPMLAREKVDYLAVDLMHQWFLTLETPPGVTINKDSRHQQKHVERTVLPDRSMALHGPGLQLEIQFYQSNFVPPVFALYWPEDHGLSATAVMDQQGGYFTDKLIVGNKGSMLTLRNSDDVGHTIYVKDKQHGVKWQLNYMPPDSAFEQPLFWDEDIFVEMKCRLHLYMSSWVGSINSRYYKIVELAENETYKQISMSGFPEKFHRLKIWLPNYEVISTEIALGEEQAFELRQGGQLQGKISIKRSAQ